MPLPRANPFASAAVLADELEIAGGIWSSMVEGGYSAPGTLAFDVEFIGATNEPLNDLAAFLRQRNYDLGPPTRRRFLRQKLNRHMEGRTEEMRIDEDCLLVWVAEMVRVAAAFGCQFGDWGALYDPKSPTPFPKPAGNPEIVFRQGVESFRKDDLTAAFSSFLASTEIAPDWADGYDGMGSVAMDLGLLGLALRQYDRAVELQPDEPSYRLNRGACRDYRRDYHGALADYELVIARLPTNPTAFFNRGNTYHNLGDHGRARADWRRAFDLGCADAGRALERHGAGSSAGDDPA